MTDEPLPDNIAALIEEIDGAPVFVPCMAGLYVIAVKPTADWPNEECLGLGTRKITIQIHGGRFHFCAWLCEDHMTLFKRRFHVIGPDGVAPPKDEH